MKHYISPAGSLFAYELDGSQDDLIPADFVLATDAQVQAIQNPPQPVPTYFELRAKAYPPITNQLDLIYNKGIDAWRKEIEKVKQQYPKT